MNKKLLMLICTLLYSTAALADEPTVEPATTPREAMARAIGTISRENEELTKEENDICIDGIETFNPFLSAMSSVKEEDQFKSFKKLNQQLINITLDSFLKRHIITKTQFYLILFKRTMRLDNLSVHLSRLTEDRNSAGDVLGCIALGMTLLGPGLPLIMASDSILKHYPQSKWAQFIFSASKLSIAAGAGIILLPFGADIVYNKLIKPIYKLIETKTNIINQKRIAANAAINAASINQRKKALKEEYYKIIDIEKILDMRPY